MWFFKISCVVVVLALGGCGFRPLYGQREGGGATDHMAAVRVGVIEDRAGQLLRNALLEQLQPGGQPGLPLYALNVKLTETVQQLALQKDETTSRSNLELRAAYVLKRFDNGATLFEGVSRAATGFNVVSSHFATLSAESDARKRSLRVLSEDIKVQLGAYFSRGTP